MGQQGTSQNQQIQPSLSTCAPANMQTSLLVQISSLLQKSNFIGMLQSFMCNPTPTVCDSGLAPSIYGSNWTYSCAKYFIANYMDCDGNIIYNNLMNICNITAQSNNLTNSTLRNLVSTGSSVSVISGTDPTTTDTIIYVPTNTIDYMASNITIDGSSSTTASGSNNASLTLVNNNAIGSDTAMLKIRQLFSILFLILVLCN